MFFECLALSNLYFCSYLLWFCLLRSTDLDQDRNSDFKLMTLIECKWYFARNIWQLSVICKWNHFFILAAEVDYKRPTLARSSILWSGPYQLSSVEFAISNNNISLLILVWRNVNKRSCCSQRFRPKCVRIMLPQWLKASNKWKLSWLSCMFKRISNSLTTISFVVGKLISILNYTEPETWYGN